jgi:hypothetical protein
MLDSIFSDAASGGASLLEIFLCTLASLVFGFAISRIYMWRTAYSRTLAVAIILLPAIVQSVIFLVNGNLGMGLAVMGAFTLVRFRSVPGSAKEIACIFFAMAVGLATGMGYLLYAAVFVAIVGLALTLLTGIRYGDRRSSKSLNVTIPEDLDYETIFDDIFQKYTTRADLERVKTTSLGSLFELRYNVVMRKGASEREFLDQIRCRNGNLNIVLGRDSKWRDEL